MPHSRCMAGGSARTLQSINERDHPANMHQPRHARAARPRRCLQIQLGAGSMPAEKAVASAG